MRKIAVRIAVGLLLAGVVHWMTRPSVRYPLAPGQLYGVYTEANQTAVDLPLADRREHYLLVVSNLSSATSGGIVDLEVARADAVRSIPLWEMPRFEPAPLASDWREYVSLPATTPRRRSPSRARSFWLHTSGGSAENPAAYRQIEARLAGEGRYVRVYVDRDDEVAAATIQEIIERFDHSVRPTAQRYLGMSIDVDGDGRFAILMTSWLSRLDGGRASLGGMVNARDFDTSIAAPFSNHADVLYLNASVRGGPHLETLLAHEYAHAISSCGHLLAKRLWFSGGREEAWLNEAISHVAENLQSDNWTNLDHRVARFLTAPEQTPLVVPNYQAAGMWRSPGPRGSTYLFLRWCVDQYGTGVLPALIYSGRTGVGNLEAATGEPFDGLYRRFAADLFLETIRLADGHHRAHTSHGLPRVDVGGPLGQWGLAGPKFEHWDLADPIQRDRQLRLAPTSSQYFVVSASRAGARRLRVAADENVSLQLSIVRLPDTLPRLELEARPTADGGWQLAVHESSGTPVEVSHVAWETLVPDRQAAGHKTQTMVRREELTELFDKRKIPGGGHLVGRPVTFDELPPGPLAVRVVARDRRGRRVTAWTTIEPGAAPNLGATARMATAGTAILTR